MLSNSNSSDTGQLENKVNELGDKLTDLDKTVNGDKTTGEEGLINKVNKISGKIYQLKFAYDGRVMEKAVIEKMGSLILHYLKTPNDATDLKFNVSPSILFTDLFPKYKETDYRKTFYIDGNPYNLEEDNITRIESATIGSGYAPYSFGYLNAGPSSYFQASDNFAVSYIIYDSGENKTYYLTNVVKTHNVTAVKWGAITDGQSLFNNFGRICVYTLNPDEEVLFALNKFITLQNDTLDLLMTEVIPNM